MKKSSAGNSMADKILEQLVWRSWWADEKYFIIQLHLRVETPWCTVNPRCVISSVKCISRSLSDTISHLPAAVEIKSERSIVRASSNVVHLWLLMNKMFSWLAWQLHMVRQTSSTIRGVNCSYEDIVDGRDRRWWTRAVMRNYFIVALNLSWSFCGVKRSSMKFKFESFDFVQVRILLYIPRLPRSHS